MGTTYSEVLQTLTDTSLRDADSRYYLHGYIRGRWGDVQIVMFPPDNHKAAWEMGLKDGEADAHPIYEYIAIYEDNEAYSHTQRIG